MLQTVLLKLYNTDKTQQQPQTVFLNRMFIISFSAQSTKSVFVLQFSCMLKSFRVSAPVKPLDMFEQ